MGKGGAPGDVRCHQGGGVGESGSVPPGPYPSSAAVTPVSLESPGLEQAQGGEPGQGGLCCLPYKSEYKYPVCPPLLEILDKRFLLVP